MELREKELIERVLGGDTAAFEPLVLPYRRTLVSLAYRIVRDAEDAKEIAQEALLRSFRYLARCDVERSFRNWLYQILVNAARDFRRRREQETRWRSDAPVEDESSAGGASVEDAHEAAALRARLLESLAVLSAKEREVFVLRDMEQMSIKEASEALKISAVAVRVHLSRARQKLRIQLNEMKSGDEGNHR